jgi:hypothetical protein
VFKSNPASTTPIVAHKEEGKPDAREPPGSQVRPVSSAPNEGNVGKGSSSSVRLFLNSDLVLSDYFLT